MGDVRHFIDGAVEYFFIRFRRLGETAKLPNKLQRRRPNLIIRRRRRKIMQGLNVSTHKEFLTADPHPPSDFIVTSYV